MKRHSRYFLILFGTLLFFSCEKKEDTSQQPQFTNMEKYIEYKCTMCHFSKRIFQETRKPEEWANIVPRMRTRNQQFISAEDEQKILEYLIKNKSTTGKE